MEKTIKEILKHSIRGKAYAKDLVYSKLPDAIPYVGVSDLSKRTENFNLDISKIDRKIAPEKAQKLVDFSAILVSLIGTNLKPTYFKYEGQPIITSSDIIALQFEEHISPEFIIIQLYSRYVEIQTQMLVSETTIPRIHTDDFFNIKLIIPSLEEQQRQVVKFLLAEKEKANIEITEAKEEIKITEYELIASVAHSFKNKLSPIVMEYAILLDLLHEIAQQKKPLNFEDLVRPILEGDTQDDIETIGTLANRIDRSLKTLPKVFNDFRILQKEILQKEIVNLSQYLKAATKNYASNLYKIQIIPSPKKLLVSIDKEAFQSVLENLIDNAVTHGFKDKALHYVICFDISAPIHVTPDGEKFAKMIYKDNGVGFIANYGLDDYKTFGNKSVYSKGSGIGGFIVNKMIELHKGSVRFLAISEENSFRTQIEILLPLED